jgi:F-type H+-transporting ATPase subunit delta
MASSTSENGSQETVMDVTVDQVARVYAKAFMGLPAKTSDPEALVEELKSLVTEVLDKFPQLERTLASSLVSDDQKERILDRVFGKFASTQVLNFLKVLSRHGRLDLLRDIVRNVQKLHIERSGRTQVEVRVATQLDDTLREEIVNRIRRAIDREPLLNIKIDPSLIAGIVVRVGDTVFDGSLKTRLEQARRDMISRAIEQIETQPARFATT